MQVNYVREHERFIEYAADERLTPNEQLLWYALVHIFNQRAEGSEWPDGFIRITNDRLFTYLPIKWDAMAKARNGLKQRGLIDFRSGSRNKSAPEYRMKWFYPSCCPFKTDNTGGNTGGNPGGNTGGNDGGSPGGIYYKHNIDGNGNQETDEDDDDDVVYTRAREDDGQDADQRIEQGFLDAFGTLPYPAALRRLAQYARMRGFSPEMVCLAMRRAAEHCATKPVQMTISILEEWWQNRVMQPHQVDQYQVEFDSRHGRNGLFASGDPVEDYYDAEKAKRFREAENQRAGYA